MLYANYSGIRSLSSQGLSGIIAVTAKVQEDFGLTVL